MIKHMETDMLAHKFIDAVTHVDSDSVIEAKLNERFEMLDLLTRSIIDGTSRAMIVSGPPGLGKSYTVEDVLSSWGEEDTDFTIVKGYVRPTGLIKTLYRHRAKNQVIVFDDADAIFFDDTSLNLLKAVCDTTERRRVSYLSEAILIDEETSERIPSSFDFDGGIIFITNYDFDDMIDRRHKLAGHLAALVSRAHYIDLAMKTKRDYIVRIKSVIKKGMLNNLSNQDKREVIDFIEEHSDNLRELSLRMAIKIGNLAATRSDWKRMARVTCLRHT